MDTTDMIRRLLNLIGSKAQSNSAAHNRSSLGGDAVGRYSSRLAKASAITSVKAFNGYVYAAAMINARGFASIPLRLYRTMPGNGERSYSRVVRTKSVPHSRMAYLGGANRLMPSKTVLNQSNGGNVEEVVDHPAIDLMRNVNPSMNGYTFALLRSLFLQLTGNVYLHPVVGRGTGVPVELWPMPSQWVEIVADDSGGFVKGYVYGRNTISERTFAPDEVIHDKLPNPEDLWYGRGWVSAAYNAVQILGEMDKYEMDLFADMARPDWGVFVKENLTDPQWNRMIEGIDQALRRRNGRPFIFEGGVDARTMQFSPRDLAFAEGEERKIEVVAAASGVPMTKLKANDPNRSNAAEGDHGWLSGTIHPYLTADEEFLNQSLLPLFGDERLFFAYDECVKRDEVAQVTRLVALVGAQIITRNEARLDLGYEAIEGGDEFEAAEPDDPPDEEDTDGDDDPTDPGESEVQRRTVGDDADRGAGGRGGVVLGDEYGQGSERVSAEHGSKDAGGACVCAAGSGKPYVLNTEYVCGCGTKEVGDSADNIRAQEENQAADDIAAAVLLALRSQESTVLDVIGGRQINAAITTEVTESVARMAGVLTEAIANGLERIYVAGGREIAATASALTAGQGLPAATVAEMVTAATQAAATAAQSAAVSGQNAAVLIEAVKESIATAVEAIATNTGATASIEFGRVMDTVVEAANIGARRIAQQVSGTTGKVVEDVLTQMAAEGASPARVAAELRARGDLFSPARAEMIARTETSKAYQRGKMAAWTLSRTGSRVFWKLAPNACEYCKAMAEKFGDEGKSIPMGQPFARVGDVIEGVDGGKMMIGFEDVDTCTLHPHCRCDVEIVIEGVDDDDDV